eukprot:2256047-Lingulodinium_polyedra.AAC.1
MDDAWVLDEEGGHEEPAARWVEAVVAQRVAVGLVEHGKKRVENEVGAEVRGVVVHPDRHWRGFSLPERF